MKKTTKAFLYILIIFTTFSVSAAGSNGFDFQLDFGIDYSLSDSSNIIGINLQPDISIGNWGVGLIGTVHYKINDGIVTEEWIPEFGEDDTLLEKVKTVSSLYFPIFRYIRYGFKGDPLYMKFGQLDNVVLGTGIFMNNYSNTALLPDTKLVGAELDVDGALFGIPFIGFESFVGDIAQLDILAGRLYIRPLSFTEIPIINSIQIGGSYVTDRAPNLYQPESTVFTTYDPAPVVMYGGDVKIPIISSGIFSFGLFGDWAFQQDPNTPETMNSAKRAGFNGNILGFIPYQADLLFPDAGFIPNYFNATYDLERDAKYASEGITDTENYFIHGQVGFSIFDDNLVLNVDLSGELENNDGNFNIIEPDMIAYMKLGEDLLPFFNFEAAWKKTFTYADSSEILDDLTSLKNSQLKANVNVKYSIIKTSFSYIVDFDSESKMGEPQIQANVTVPLF